jgi:GTP pyrophosphokinase
VGLLKDILTAIAEHKTNVVSINSRVRKDKVAVTGIVMDIRNVSQLTAVMQRIGQVKDVLSVERVVPH